MTALYIDGINAPDEIKESVNQLSSDFIFYRESSKGANGYLFFGKNKITNIKIALKFYYWGNNKAYHAEPQKLSHINSDNVIKILNAAYLDDDWAYFITPLCENGDIDDFIETTDIGNHKAIDMVSQILIGISFLHSERFIHRDLKPSNIYLCDEERVVIGDFGSIKHIPVGLNSIPASSHSILYRPPESVTTNAYGISGDIYQIGMVLYQLLGGYLPYDEISWLNQKELVHYNSLIDNFDKSAFVDQCLKNKIIKSKILSMSSLPPWVPDNVKRIIKKACHKDPNQRFVTASEFKAKLHQIKPQVLDWSLVNGIPTLVKNGTTFNIIDESGILKVRKKKASSWRYDHSFTGDLKTIIEAINNNV